MDNKGDSLTRIQSFEQGIEVTAMLNEAIGVGTAVRQLLGVSHADQVGSDATAQCLQVRQHVAP